MSNFFIAADDQTAGPFIPTRNKEIVLRIKCPFVLAMIEDSAAHKFLLPKTTFSLTNNVLEYARLYNKIIFECKLSFRLPEVRGKRTLVHNVSNGNLTCGIQSSRPRRKPKRKPNGPPAESSRTACKPRRASDLPLDANDDSLIVKRIKLDNKPPHAVPSLIRTERTTFNSRRVSYPPYDGNKKVFSYTTELSPNARVMSMVSRTKDRIQLGQCSYETTDMSKQTEVQGVY